ncbi:hypothetical protein DU472_04510 [Campylobacter novaezeelandiae]|uniref:hypothetical protein n=1 Tax=Campylobacter novaezeelandiae TaxID=2267891 RepID=UPI001037206A|nr:hypothetical protein [Campylobacter novaezeelandiae]TBR80925.1 hypothetical protein DU472_04510 [Campylobacter novaezeelandiae]
MNLQGKIKKIEQEKKKLLKLHKDLFKNSNEIDLYELVVAREFSKFYEIVNRKYHYKTIEWDERMGFAQDYRDFLEKIQNIELLQTFINKKSKDNANGYKVGDILYSNWGYEQTNVEFYQVVATTEKAIWLANIKEKIKMSGWGQGVKSPCKNNFIFKQKAFKTLSNSPKDSRDGYAKYLYNYKGKAVYFSNDY